MRVSLAVAVSSSIVALQSCSCGGVRADDFPAQSAKTVCTKVYQCCTAAEAKPTSYGPDPAGCEAKVGASALDPNAVKRAESAGRLVYRADKASDCLTQYAALTCEQLKVEATSRPAACDGVTEPKVPLGGACSSDRECIGGTCDGEASGVDGVCRAFVAESGSCADGGVCGSGLFCSGGACTRTRDDGAECTANFECTTGGCNGRDAGTPGRCGLKGGAGTACFATTGCSSSGGGVAAALALLVLVAAVRRRATA